MITLICGTNRNDAVSRTISNIYSDLLKEKGVAHNTVDLIELPDNFLNNALYENSGKDPDVNAMINKMGQSTKYLIIVPEYNGSFPGVLKSFIDALPYPSAFNDKKAALVGLSSGIQGAGLALSHLTDILNYCGCHVLAFKPKLARISKHLDQDQIISTEYQELIREQIDRFLEF
jgi:NAD(P)H-dependent FMN reductase